MCTKRLAFLFWQTTKNSRCMKEILLEIRYFERDYQKPFRKLTLLFLSNPVHFNGQSYQKQKGPGTSDQSLFRL